MLKLVSLRVLHFELGHVVPGFVLVGFKVQLYDGTVPDGERLPLLHDFESLGLEGGWDGVFLLWGRLLVFGLAG